MLWRKKPEEKGITGSDVRRRIRDNLAWKDLVPSATVGLIEQFNLQARLQG